LDKKISGRDRIAGVGKIKNKFSKKACPTLKSLLNRRGRSSQYIVQNWHGNVQHRSRRRHGEIGKHYGAVTLASEYDVHQPTKRWKNLTDVALASDPRRTRWKKERSKNDDRHSSKVEF